MYSLRCLVAVSSVLKICSHVAPVSTAAFTCRLLLSNFQFALTASSTVQRRVIQHATNHCMEDLEGRWWMIYSQDLLCVSRLASCSLLITLSSLVYIFKRSLKRDASGGTRLCMEAALVWGSVVITAVAGLIYKPYLCLTGHQASYVVYDPFISHCCRGSHSPPLFVLLLRPGCRAFALLPHTRAILFVWKSVCNLSGKKCFLLFIVNRKSHFMSSTVMNCFFGWKKLNVMFS